MRSIPNFREGFRRFRECLPTTLFPDFSLPELPRWQVFVRMIVPGWAQWYCGFPVRGGIYLGAYLFCLIVGIFLLGTGLGNLLMGLAVACHASSALDIILSREYGIRARLFSSMIILALLFWGLYIPLWTFTTRYFQPMTIRMSMAGIHAGDVLIVNPRGSAAVGESVIYEIPPAETTMANAGHGQRRYVWRGQRVDRILAGPGQHVILKNGKLAIDGKSSRFLPLAPIHSDWTLDVTVGPGQWLILPTTDPFSAMVPLPAVCLVPTRSITAVVLFRSYPYSRFGRLSSPVPSP